MKEITSRQNAKFKLWSSLLESQGIKREGLCLVGGKKVLEEIQSERPSEIVELIHPAKGDRLFENEAYPATRLTGDLFKTLDVAGVKSTLAVVRTPPVKEFKPGPPEGLEVVAALSDPVNLGALIRSAEAFGARRLILTKECASPFLPKALRAASGSVFRLNLVRACSLHEFSAPGAWGLDLKGESLTAFCWPKNIYLILGEEGQGLPAQNEIPRLKIPMAPGIESLNATAAASVALFSYRLAHPL